MNIASIIFASTIFACSQTIAVAQSFVEPTFKVRAIKDVFYGTAVRFDGGTDSLRMNIYVPTNDNAATRPLVVWIHGGGFIQGSRSDFNALAETWAKRGYTAVTISYRLGIHGNLFDPPFAYDEAELIRACFRGIQDVRGGLRFLVKNAAAYGIDTSRIVIGGASAGSIIALHAAFFDSQDAIPTAAGSISDVVRLNGTFKRPTLGSPEGNLHLDVPTPGIDVVMNIFGALLDLKFLGGAPFVPMYSYHQTDDPVVACGVNRPYHAVGIVSANYPFMSGTCAIEDELKRRGVPASDRETLIHQGAAHDVHDPAGVDRAAAVFAGRRVASATSVHNDRTTSRDVGGLWTLIGMDGREVARDISLGRGSSVTVSMADGVYLAVQDVHRRLVVLRDGGIAAVQ